MSGAEPLGIVSDILAKRASMRAAAIRRGMSPSALARLPQPARFDTDILLPPVMLATKRDATNLVQQAQARADALGRKKNSDWAPGKAVIHATQVTSIPRAINYRIGGNQIQRAKAIVALVAAVNGIEAHQITGHGRERRIVGPRKMAIRAIYQFVRLAQARITDLFGCDFHTVHYHLKHSEWLLQNNAAFAASYAKACDAIKTRWPEYGESK